MSAIPCITNITARSGGCRIHGEHRSDCRGIQYDPRSQRATECKGCLPQPATHGLLCSSCWERFEAALDGAVDHITHMRSVERGPIPDGPPVHTAPASRVIVPTSWLTADDSWAALHELAFRADPLELLQVRPGGTTPYGFGSRDSIEHVRDRVELAVDIVRASGIGIARSGVTAELAVQFYRRTQQALHAFPIREDARQYRYATCKPERGGCGLRSLERRPPLEYFEPVTVRCINPACGAVWDPVIVELDLASMRHDLEAAVAA